LRLRLHAKDLRLDHDIVRAANHQEMFDIVAPDDHELTLTVQRKGVDQSKPRLARPTPSGKSQSMTEQGAVGDYERDDGDNGDRGERCDLQRAIVAKRKIS
jgi:hypothetical protein